MQKPRYLHDNLTSTDFVVLFLCGLRLYHFRNKNRIRRTQHSVMRYCRFLTSEKSEIIFSLQLYICVKNYERKVVWCMHSPPLSCICVDMLERFTFPRWNCMYYNFIFTKVEHPTMHKFNINISRFRVKYYIWRISTRVYEPWF